MDIVLYKILNREKQLIVCKGTRKKMKKCCVYCGEIKWHRNIKVDVTFEK